MYYNKFVIFILFCGNIGCNPGNDELTADACERLTNRTSCRDRGCTFAEQRQRSIELDGHCRAFEPAGPICLAASESVNNVTMEIYRKTGSGTEHVSLGSGYTWVLGWLDEGEFFARYPGWTCGPEPGDCEAQTDRDACESRACFWADEVRVGIIDGDTCTGWEPGTVSRCLAPNPYLIIGSGGNSFESPDGRERFVVGLSTGTRVYELPVSSVAAFHSRDEGASVPWRPCLLNGYDPLPACNCPE